MKVRPVRFAVRLGVGGVRKLNSKQRGKTFPVWRRLNAIQAIGVLTSLAALYTFNVGGDAGWLTPWLPLALIPILLWGVCALFQKIATTRASIELVTAAFLLGEFPVALVTPLFQPTNLHLPGATWGLLFLLGLLFGLGNLTLIFAYGSGGKASVVTPMASLYSLVTIPFAIWLLHERIGPREAVGIALALVAVVALGWEKTPDPGEGDMFGGK